MKFIVAIVLPFIFYFGLGWIAKEHYYVSEKCREYLREVGVYSWKDDKDEPEDRNDHTINACQYAWLPYIAEIGKET